MDHTEKGFLRIENGRVEWIKSEYPRSLADMQGMATAAGGTKIDVASVGEYGVRAKDGSKSMDKVAVVFDEEMLLNPTARPCVFSPATGTVLCGPVVLCKDAPLESVFPPLALGSALSVLAGGMLVLIPSGVEAEKPEPKGGNPSPSEDGGA